MTSARPTAGARAQSIHFPPQLLAGLILIAVAWPIAWSGPSALREFTFFPLWLGYALTIDGLVDRIAGPSLLRRSPRAWGALFLISAPLWWGFEAANARLGNWEYILPHHYSFVRYHLQATISFSTVLPAVFETAELAWALGMRNAGRHMPKVDVTRRGYVLFSVAGALMIAAVLAAPRQFFPLIWLGLFFLVDPINARNGVPSVIAGAARGDWSRPFTLFAAGLTCGFFWEMWNSHAMPKWVYHVPYVGVGKLFETPVLGYGGYLPFALELYACFHLVRWLAGQRGPSPLRIDQGAHPGDRRP